MRVFRATRTLKIIEEVEVIAKNYDEARQMIEDDEDVVVRSESETDYEIDGIIDEVKV